MESKERWIAKPLDSEGSSEASRWVKAEMEDLQKNIALLEAYDGSTEVIELFKDRIVELIKGYSI